MNSWLLKYYIQEIFYDRTFIVEAHSSASTQSYSTRIRIISFFYLENENSKPAF